MPACPVIQSLTAIPVAARDSVPLSLSAAHGSFFVRNLVVLTDGAGRTSVGEVPVGEKIRQSRAAAVPRHLMPGLNFDPKRPCTAR